MTDLPYWPIKPVISCATRLPDGDVSATNAWLSPREVIDHAQDAELPPADQAVGDEVERPALVLLARQRHWCRMHSACLRIPRRRTRSPSSRYRRSSFLWLGRTPSSDKQEAQPLIADPTALTRQLPQPLPQACIVRLRRSIRDHPTAHPDHSTRPALHQPVIRTGMRTAYRFAPDVTNLLRKDPSARRCRVCPRPAASLAGRSPPQACATAGASDTWKLLNFDLYW
jgi:hypothetical protein